LSTGEENKEHDSDNDEDSSLAMKTNIGRDKKDEEKEETVRRDNI
jgi:hypothetical protein